jgi:glycine C-acetyltransferase
MTVADDTRIPPSKRPVADLDGVSRDEARERIRRWILERIAREVGLAAEDMDPEEPFDSYGLDSLNAVVIAGDLEDWLGRSLSSSLLYECPTAASLADYLTREERPAAGTAPTPESGGREGGLLGAITGGERLRFRDRVGAMASFRAELPPGTYLRVLDSACDREVVVVDTRTGHRRSMLMFGSNNYLGLAAHPEVVERAREAAARYGVGLAGPAVLNGYTTLHRELEERLAAFKHAEDVMVYPTGYAANLGALGSLPVRGDTVYIDELVHASVVDAVASSPARAVTFAHNDMDALEALLTSRTDGGDAFVVVEGVYSMDGDLAPLDALAPLCEKTGAILAVDDAHGTGVLGGGRGAAAHFGVTGRVPLQIGTFSKAFASVGGFVAASRDIIDYLRFLSRTYTFSAALPPPVVAAVLASLDVIEREPERVARLHDNVAYAREALGRVGIAVEASAGVLALMAPPGMDIRDAARRFHDAGLFVNPVEYPAVARDKERIRAGIMCTHTREDLDAFAACAGEIWERATGA